MAPLTPEERTRLLAELEAEFEAAERSIREEGVVTAEELELHMDALLRELAQEEEQEKRLAKRGAMLYQLSPQALRDLDRIVRYRAREAGVPTPPGSMPI